MKIIMTIHRIKVHPLQQRFTCSFTCSEDDRTMPYWIGNLDVGNKDELEMLKKATKNIEIKEN